MSTHRGKTRRHPSGPTSSTSSANPQGGLQAPLTFIFLSAALGENPQGHALFYGNLVVLAAGGAGSWRRAAGRAPFGRLAFSAPSR
jgi:hypothetical protein